MNKILRAFRTLVKSRQRALFAFLLALLTSLSLPAEVLPPNRSDCTRLSEAVTALGQGIRKLGDRLMVSLSQKDSKPKAISRTLRGWPKNRQSDLPLMREFLEGASRVSEYRDGSIYYFGKANGSENSDLRPRMSFEIAKANGRDSTYKVVLDLGDWAQREDTAILNLEAKITKLLEGVRGQWSWVHTNQEQDAPNKRRTSINLLLETQPPPELIQFLSYVNRSYLLAYDEGYFSARGGLFEIPSLILELRTPKESQNKKYIIKYSLSHVPGSHTTAAAYQLAPEVTREVLPYVESLVLWFIRTDGIALTKTYPIEFQNTEAELRPGGFIIHNAERSREVGRVEAHHAQGKLVYWALFEYSPVPPKFQKKLTLQNDKAE